MDAVPTTEEAGCDAWQEFQTLESRKSIALQEFFTIVVASLVWGHRWTGKCVLFYHNNQAVADF